ncbi:TetR/AcrR family transcriptional regulator [Actinoplanes sp. NBRC 103695]|uniref:TetR/AcrR family transcriptional regulator n=1 Tax=Actinoplanes sp. NBRC 103695 TaxID=3032202 RepID=UPI0024A22178|nr:TetR/AcrR family transcriptional regulator [Actinoplanes sp. NBRC 103695]GLY95272.1 TetR family transcriptional regulator [Actinoplanes sp. NBRC 103695]
MVKRALSRDRVLAAAVELVDAEGVGALTMRRLATEVEVEAMSLYHHLHGKEALLDGVVETVLAEIPRTADTPDWRQTLRRQFLAARQVMLRHPWAPGLLASRRSIPVAVLGYYDRMVGVLLEAGFGHHLAHRALHSLGSLPLGFAQEVFTPAGGLQPDLAEADLRAMAAAVPHITAMVAAEVNDHGGDTLGWCDSQSEFEFTLDLLLTGLDRLRHPKD